MECHPVLLLSLGRQKEMKARNNLIYLLTFQLSASDAIAGLLAEFMKNER